jgi:hypothetical protein
VRVFTDAELTELALAADAGRPLGDDAMPIGEYLRDERRAALPDWYMPVAVRFGPSRGRRAVVLTIVAAFLVVNAAGLCSTYGQLVFG